MIIRIGYIPYLNLAPFYRGFGPAPMEAGGRRYEFWTRSPRALGIDAQSGLIDAGPLSLIDSLRCESQYEPLSPWGIGVRRAAQSVLLFSRIALPLLHNAFIAVTDETATSVLLLQQLIEQRYQLQGVRFGRVAGGVLSSEEADGLLLIGDEALRARREGVRGFPAVTDLGEEWFAWQQTPFVFARWMVRRALAPDVKAFIQVSLEKSLASQSARPGACAAFEAENRQLSIPEIVSYWNGFSFQLTPSHLQAIDQFSQMVRPQCLTA